MEEKEKKLKTLKAKANLRRTPLAKIADQLTAFFGSAQFLLLNITIFFAWIAINSQVIPGMQVFDPFPYVLLITLVSLEAIFLSIFVLISQNRQTQIEDRREEVELLIALKMEEQNTKILKMLKEIQEKLKIVSSHDKDLHKLSQKVNAETIVNQVDKEIVEEHMVRL